jgi:hypothetical protein
LSFGLIGSGIEKPHAFYAVLDSLCDFARVSHHGYAEETAEGKIGWLAQSDQAWPIEGPGSAGQDTEEEEDREEGEDGGPDSDSPIHKAAGEGYRTGIQVRGAGITRRQASRGNCPEHGITA